MNVVKVLSKDIFELIAAGEVIERPASVIKELVENSIDAEARNITVEIKNGGITYMKVTDDGNGMSYNDVSTAFLRHATSKIKTKDDLNSIYTLGFRGEALASVAAVSKVEVFTKEPGSSYGTRYLIEGSEEVLKEEAGCPNGTSVIVRDLFYNIPARLKFMKKDAAEGNSVVAIMNKLALSHPEIAFKVIRDNKIELNSAGDSSLFSAIYAVYGKDFAYDMIKVDYEEAGIKVHGYAVKPLYAKHNRSFQNFFINGRYVKAFVCSLSIEEAYKNLISPGKFPACVLNIERDPGTLDVNVHPAKTEVRFSDDKIIFNGIYFAVKNALIESGLEYDFHIKKKTDWRSMMPEKKDENMRQAVISAVEPMNTFNLREAAGETESITSNKSGMLAGDEDIPYSGGEKVNDIDYESESGSGFKYISDRSFLKTEKQEVPEYIAPEEEPEDVRVIGEAFLNYIIAEAAGNILIIDKHAAHERIIYEMLKNDDVSNASQKLLLPCRTLLSEEEFEAVEQNAEKLLNMGFGFDFSSKPFLVTVAVPLILERLDADEIIPEIAQNIYENKINPQTNRFDETLHTLACRAAVRANDKNSMAELNSIALEVYNNKNIRHCPHGRPVLFILSKKELEKQFKRG